MNNEEWCKKNCPYSTDCACDGVCNFVLSMLKEQEAVAPYLETGKFKQLYRCGNCHTYLVFTKQDFCHGCGRRVKWND